MVTNYIETDEYMQILKAESDTPEHIICPRCHNKMHVISMPNGARIVKCEKEGCISVSFRGI